MYNVVLVKHDGDESGKWYLFSLPAGVKLNKNQMVKVKTRYGDRYGSTVSDSAQLNNEAFSLVMNLCGAKLPLQPVLGVYSFQPFYVEEC